MVLCSILKRPHRAIALAPCRGETEQRKYILPWVYYRQANLLESHLLIFSTFTITFVFIVYVHQFHLFIIERACIMHRNSTSCSPNPSARWSRFAAQFSSALNSAVCPSVFHRQPNSLTSLTTGSTRTSHRTWATEVKQKEFFRNF